MTSTCIHHIISCCTWYMYIYSYAIHVMNCTRYFKLKGLRTVHNWGFTILGWRHSTYTRSWDLQDTWLRRYSIRIQRDASQRQHQFQSRLFLKGKKGPCIFKCLSDTWKSHLITSDTFGGVRWSPLEKAVEPLDMLCIHFHSGFRKKYP